MNISVLGCGWLGLPLAKSLIANGYKVKGSTTTSTKLERLEEEGIEPFLISLTPTGTKGNIHEFLQSDILILNTPPGGRRNPEVEYTYPRSIEHLFTYIQQSSIKHILFVSSTSVYGNATGRVTEATPPTPQTPSGRALLQVEQLISQNPSTLSTFLRFGGLIGGNRKPGRFLAGRKDLPRPFAPINLIHLSDCINIITQIIEQEKWGEILNAAADRHPNRKVFYTFAAEKLKLSPPQFVQKGGENGKWIDNTKLKSLLGYSFLFPDPFQFL